MKVGDLVLTKYGEFGIIISQAEIVDRWMIRWFPSPSTSIQYSSARWGYDLEILS